MNKEVFQKLFKPPYIFIVFGVVLLAVIMIKKNQSDDSVTYDETSQTSGLDTYNLMEQFSTANEVLENIIGVNAENISILSEKLDTNIYQLTDLIRVNDENYQNDIAEIKENISSLNETFTSTPVKQSTTSNKTTTTSKKYFTISEYWTPQNTSRTTLSGIAQSHGLSLKEILNLNPSYKSNPNLVHVGDKIRVA